MMTTVVALISIPRGFGRICNVNEGVETIYRRAGMSMRQRCTLSSTHPLARCVAVHTHWMTVCKYGLWVVETVLPNLGRHTAYSVIPPNPSKNNVCFLINVKKRKNSNTLTDQNKDTFHLTVGLTLFSIYRRNWDWSSDLPVWQSVLHASLSPVITNSHTFTQSVAVWWFTVQRLWPPQFPLVGCMSDGSSVCPSVFVYEYVLLKSHQESFSNWDQNLHI